MKNIVFLVLALSVLNVTGSQAQGWRWGRSGTGVDFDAFGVATDASGNVFGAGDLFPLFDTTVQFGGISVVAQPSQTAYVKYDHSGTPLWALSTTDTMGDGSCFLNNICTDPDGNLIIYGTFYGYYMEIGPLTLTDSLYPYRPDAGQFFLAKISPTGTVLWAINAGNNVYYNPQISGIRTLPALVGGAGVTTDAAGNIYICGTYPDSAITIGSYTLPCSGGADIFVAKYAPDGSLVWASSAGGAGDDFGISITVAATGNVYVGGFMYSPSITVGGSTVTNPYTGKPRTLIASFSPAGVPLWADASGGPNGAFAFGVTADNYGNVFMTGGFRDTTISFGSVPVTRAYPGSVPQLALYLVKYDPSGVVTWGKSISSRDTGTFGYTIAMAPCGQVWVSGVYSDTIFIDTIRLAPPHGVHPDPVFIAGYDLSGGVVGAAGMNSGGDDQNGIACDASGNVFLCSDYEANMVVGPDSLIVYGRSAENLYVAKYQNSIPPDTISQRPTDTSICSSGTDSITLSAPTGYTNYYWNDGVLSRTRTFHTAGTYWVYCVTCGDPVLADTFRLTDAIPLDTASFVTDTIICGGTEAIPATVLTATVGATGYLWYNGLTGITDTVTTTGVFWVSYYTHCTFVTDTFRVLGVAAPDPITGHDSVCVGDTTQLRDATPGGAWTSSNLPVATCGSNSGKVAGVAPGVTTISYTTTNHCFVTTSVTVRALPCTTAIVETGNVGPDVTIYPVPATGSVTLKTDAGAFDKYIITNAIGQEFMTQNINTTNTNADIHLLPPGVYFIIFSGNNGTTVRKFLKD